MITQYELQWVSLQDPYRKFMVKDQIPTKVTILLSDRTPSANYKKTTLHGHTVQITRPVDVEQIAQQFFSVDFRNQRS